MKRFAVAGSLFLAFSALLCWGQEITGSIAGTVQDSTGAGVPGAKVVVTNTDRNAVVREAMTESNGDYNALLLPIGHYSVAVEAKGFKKSIKRGIELRRTGQDLEALQLFKRAYDASPTPRALAQMGVAAEVYADSPGQLEYVLQFVPSHARLPIVHLSRRVNVLHGRDRAVVKEFAERCGSGSAR